MNRATFSFFAWFLFCCFSFALAEEFPASGPESPLRGCVVPAISSVKVLPQTRLPESLVKTNGCLDVVAARGEITSGSFVLEAFRDVKRLEIAPEDLKSGSAVFPAVSMDVLVVKCWYQDGNAWHSTERDPDGPVLTPELLLHDDTLVTADDATRGNRIRMINRNGGTAETVFSPVSPGVGPALAPPMLADDDAPALRPLALPSGTCRQFWVRIAVPVDAIPGIYSGRMALTADGKEAGAFPVMLRVLPFTLPAPKTRYDLTREFAVVLTPPDSASTRSAAGADAAAAKRGMQAERLDMTALPAFPFLVGDTTNCLLADDNEAMKKLEQAQSAGPACWMEITNSADRVRDLAPLLDVCIATDANERTAELFHLVGHRYLSRGAPEPGVENPAFWRRYKGWIPYKARYDGVFIRGYYDPAGAWNDWASPSFRNRNLVYPTKTGVVSTLAWEGLREAMNDVRYLALLGELTSRAYASKDFRVRTNARLAMRWVDLADAEEGNLDTLRLEAIAWILRLRHDLGDEDRP